MRNKITDLNGHLFEQLERLNQDDLKGEDLKAEVDRAKAMTQIASQIVQSTKVTIEAMKMVKDEFTKDEVISVLAGNESQKLLTTK